MSVAYPRLFEPIVVGSLKVRNRIVSSAHGTQFVAAYRPTDRLIDYHVERARGGVGMIVLEASRIHPTTLSHERQLAGYDASLIPDYKRLADAVHAEGAALFAQIIHQGRQISSLDTRLPLWAPSPIPCPVFKEVPKEMTAADIREAVDGHAVTARNLKKAGIDGIEIHGAHGYLIQEFMSPYSNRRTDRYGGSLENRLRFAFEVIDAVRETVGPAYPVGMRVSGEEFVEGGLDVNAMSEIVPLLVARGLDFVSVSVSTYQGYSYATMIPDMAFEPGAFVYVAAAIRRALHEAGHPVPVMTVGRIVRPEQAEQILTDGAADMVIMMRALLADPELPNKAIEGREADIRECIGCNQGCVGMGHTGRPITCLVNPVAGSEAIWGSQTLRPSSDPKRVLVVGGGPAGMEAARVAAARGHQVTLWERSGELGGQVALFARLTTRSEFGKLLRWLERQLDQLGIEVVCNAEGTADAIKRALFDRVVLATGSVPVLPEIPGLDQVRMLDVSDAIRNLGSVGSRVVVLDDDRHHKAPGIAEDLADRGCEVTIVTRGGETGSEVVSVSFAGLRVRLGQKRIRTLPFHDVVRADGRRVVVRDQFSGLEQRIDDVDSIVVAGQNRSSRDLELALGGEVITVGDCVAPRRALDAMREGHAAGVAV